MAGSGPASSRGATLVRELKRADRLLALGVVYGAASLAHHVHNAVYLYAYPNLPASLSVARVAAAWCLTALTGVVGYVLVRGRHELGGLLLLALYAGLGLFGLAHYHLAPIAAHSSGMNASIGFEVATATLLLIAVVRALIARVANRPVPAAYAVATYATTRRRWMRGGKMKQS